VPRRRNRMMGPLVGPPRRALITPPPGPAIVRARRRGGEGHRCVYVWWDALANYVTALDGPRYDEWWAGDGERVHVIGKGIVRFHAVYWLALLLSAGLPLPTAIFVHDYLTVESAPVPAGRRRRLGRAAGRRRRGGHPGAGVRAPQPPT